MTAPGQHDVFILREGAVAWQEVEGEMILLDLENSRYLGVNPSGTLLWRALAGGATRGELSAQLQERFGISAAQADADVDAFLADCADRNLLQ